MEQPASAHTLDQNKAKKERKNAPRIQAASIHEPPPGLQSKKETAR